MRVKDQVAVALVGIGLLCVLMDLDNAHVDAAGPVLERAVEQQVAETVRLAVDLQRLVVDMLAAGREVDAQQFGVRSLIHHVKVEEGLGQAAAPTDLDPA